MRLNRLELLLGWLAITLACAGAAYIYVAASIVPNPRCCIATDYIPADVAAYQLRSFLLLFAISLLALAVGVTLDGVLNLLPGRVLLVLATLTLAVVSAQLPFWFGAVFAASVLLALGATLIALFRPHGVSRRA
jgi:hypothetical protein